MSGLAHILSPMETIVENVACTVCGCVCDDLRLTVAENRIIACENACMLAEPWLLQQNSRHPASARTDGKPCDLGDALDAAAKVLKQSRAPLVYGLSRSSTAGQQAACALADFLGATIDTTASLGHAPSILALQEVGESTCSLGEVKNRADLVLFWGSNPAESHPRHFERYSGDAIGQWTPAGRSDRTVVVCDVQPTATSVLADLFLAIEPGGDFEVLTALRALLRGLDLAETTIAGVPVATLRDLIGRMKRCRFGVVFFGLGLTRSGLGHRTIEALLRLTSALNDHTRFYVRRMRVSGDVAGADSVLAWQTGYPFSVNLGRGYPRYNPGEFTANRMLELAEVDACILVGSTGVRRLSDRATAQLRRIPTIVLDGPLIDPSFTPTIRFTTATYGVHLAGSVYRMDEIPIPVKQVLTSDYPSDAEVLRALLAKLRGH